MPISQNQSLHRLVETRISGRRNVGLRGLAREDRLLSLSHSLYDGRIASIIPVDTDAQVDLPGVGIGPECGHEAENGIYR